MFPYFIQIWSQWKGTVFSDSWRTCIRNMLFATLVAVLYEIRPELKTKLVGFNILWGQLLSITTFTLTFFLNVSYGLWRKCYELSRRLKGRLNDLGFTMASHADRISSSNPDESGTFTPGARQVLELMARYVRVFHLLTYASFTRNHRPILTPLGMRYVFYHQWMFENKLFIMLRIVCLYLPLYIRRLVDRGLLTQAERKILINSEVPATQRHNNILLWIVRVFVEAREAGHITGGSGLEQQFMEGVHLTRAQYGAIGDELQGRMPLAYAHIVQVLVDVVLLMFPFMAFTSSKMSPWLGVFSTGLLTIFYQGLFDLAKQFLDPYDNENYGHGDDPLCVDTLVAELNAGSARWMNGLVDVPFNKDKLKEGEMGEYLLPLRGYSVEQLLEREEEEKQKTSKFENDIAMAEAEAEALTNFIQPNVNDAGEITTKSDSVYMANETTIEIPLTKSAFVNNIHSFESNNDEKNLTTSKPLQIEGLIPQIKYLESHKIDNIDIDEKREHELSKNELSSQFILNNNSYPLDEIKNYDIRSPVDENHSLKDDSAIGYEIDELSRHALKAKSRLILEEIDDIIEEEEEEEEFFVDQITSGLEELEWFEQIGPDGNEIRLSQMLADEDWEYELLQEKGYATGQREEIPLSYETYEQGEKVIIQTGRDEYLGTSPILNAPPGDSTDLEPVLILEDTITFMSEPSAVGATENPIIVNRVRMNNEINESNQMTNADVYDQTKLDSLSQLWGAGPGDLQSLRDNTSKETIKSLETNKMESFSQLWSDFSNTIKSNKIPTKSSKDIQEISDEGIAQSWGRSSNLADDSNVNGSEQDSDYLENGFEFDDLDWFNEIGVDGKEVRLSQILADEVWEEETEEIPAVETFENFSKKAIEQIEALEDEMKETEAILNAPPGSQSLGEEFDEIESEVDENDNNLLEESDHEKKENDNIDDFIADAIVNAPPGPQSFDLK